MAFLGRIDEFKPESESWSSYVERVELFFDANDISNEKRVAVLLSAVGPATYGLLRNLVQPAMPKDKTFKEVVDLLKAHYEPKPLVIAERFRFNHCSQKQGETVTQFVATLKQYAMYCDFGVGLDDALRDRFVSGIRNEACQSRLLSEERLTFARALEIALNMETAERDTQQLWKMKEHASEVHRVQVNTDKELARVRTTFVEKVSRKVINQLLDSLLKDGVLNDGEKESIVEDNSVRTDRARCLIDTIKKKGFRASEKMITHLQIRDPTLFSDLGLSCAQPAPPAAEPQMEQEWSTTLVPTTEAFWSEKVKDKTIYPVTKKSIGNRVALLITNIKFADEKLNRNGAEKDEENMEKLLGALGYEVVKHTNLTAKGIEDALIAFSTHPKLKETDSVFVVIMSHGKLGAILGVNWKDDRCGYEAPDEFPINNIYRHLASKKCPALLDKPKVIIIQACRGGELGYVLVSDCAEADVVCDVSGPSLPAAEGGIEDDGVRFVHKEKNFIAFLSCTPDTRSYRHIDCGSFLIPYIVKVFNTFAYKDDIEELFRKVMEQFEEFPFHNKKQMPTKDRCTLIKRFYLFPGL